MAKKGLYDPKLHPQQLRLLRVLNLKDKEIYDKMEISYQTFYRWKKKYAEFEQAYQDGRTALVSDGISALIKRAFGFEKEEVMQEVEKNGKGEIVKQHMKKTMKYYPPEPKLLQFALTSLAPEIFANSINVKHSGEVEKTHTIKIDDLTEEELLLISKLAFEDDTETST